MGLGDYLGSVRRRWWVLVLAVVVAVAVAVVTAPKQSGAARKSGTQYQARSVLSFTPAGSAVRSTSQALAQGQILLSTGDVPAAVAKKIGYQGNPADLIISEVVVTTDTAAATMTVTVTDSDANRAAAIADGLGQNLISVFNAKAQDPYNTTLARYTKNLADLNNQLTPLQAKYTKDFANSDPRTRPPGFDSQLKAQIDGLAKEIQDITQSAAALQSQGPDLSGFQIISKATVTQISPDALHVPNSTPLRALLGALIALLLATGLVILYERVDGRIRTRAAAEFAFGVPVLAEVPMPPRRDRRRAVVMTSAEPNSPVAEAYRVLRTSLLYAPTVPRLRPWSPDDSQPGTARPAVVEQSPWQRAAHLTLLVISPSSREGRTTTVANLAASLAETDRSVVAIDTDLRNPALDRFMGLDPSPGLTDAVASGEPLTTVARRSQIDNLLAITGGLPAASPANVIIAASQQLGSIHRVADVAVLDTPALLVANDAIALVPVADAVLLVCRWGKTKTTEAWRAIELLARLGARVAGVVIVGSPSAPTARVRRRGRKLRAGPLRQSSATPVEGNGHRRIGEHHAIPAGDGAQDPAGASTPSLD